MKFVLTVLLLALPFQATAKPDECHFPRPKIKRHYNKDLKFDKNIWQQQGFNEAELINIDIENSNQNITHELPILSAVKFKNTYWSITEVIDRMDKAAKILNQCGVRINKAHIVQAIAPNKTAIIRRHRSCFNPEPNGQHHITNNLPYMPGIRMFFIENFIVGPEAYASPDYKSKNTPIENTIWMTPPKSTSIEHATSNFQVLAHELGHILLNSGHVWDDNKKTPNLMSGKPSLLNNVLTKEQCELIKQHRLVKKINV